MDIVIDVVKTSEKRGKVYVNDILTVKGGLKKCLTEVLSKGPVNPDFTAWFRHNMTYINNDEVCYKWYDDKIAVLHYVWYDDRPAEHEMMYILN